MASASVLAARRARRSERVQISATAICRKGDTREQARLVDLSTTGARIRTFSRLAVDQRIWLRLPLLEPIEAIVIRTDRNEAGIEFCVPLHPAVFDVVRRVK